MFRDNDVITAVDEYKDIISDDESKENSKQPNYNYEEDKSFSRLAFVVKRNQIFSQYELNDTIINTNNSNLNKNNFVKELHSVEANSGSSPYIPVDITAMNDFQFFSNTFNNLTNTSIIESSAEWLKTNNLDSLGLTIEDLINKGSLGQSVADGVALNLNCLIFDEITVTEFEYKVNLAIEMYGKRIKWFLQGSRKIFGLVGGSRLGIIIDASDINLDYGRLIPFQHNLIRLLEEQLYKKKSMNIAFIGSDIEFVWENLVNLNCNVVEEARTLFSTLSSRGGCNLLQAIKQTVSKKGIDQVLMIIGSCPDQDTALLLDFIQQLLLGNELPFHCVSYESQSDEVNTILESIAELNNGNYHRYSALTEELMYTSNDIDLLLQEIEKAQDVLNKISMMRKGLFTNRENPLVDQIAHELDSEFYSRPTTSEPLSFEVAKFNPKSSSDWLTTTGIKPKKLDLFSKNLLRATSHMAAPMLDETASLSESFSDSDKAKLEDDSKRNSLAVKDRLALRKSVKGSKPPKHPGPGVNNKSSILAMIDLDAASNSAGFMRNIEIITNSILGVDAPDVKTEIGPTIGHMIMSNVYEKVVIRTDLLAESVSRNVQEYLSQLYEYQKVLGEQIKLMEQRISWLTTGSRRFFGTVIERRVLFILDLSQSNMHYLPHILHSLKALIQQQIINRDKFNFVAFNKSVFSFRPTLVSATQTNLHAAWHWIKALRCSGSRNMMAALQMALEDVSDNDVEGIYIFTSGIPDQSISPLLAYVEERLLGSSTKIHTVLFNVDDYDSYGDVIPSRYTNISQTAEVMRQLAHISNGRFHWFRESGIIENDDIRILMSEIDLAMEYSRRLQLIVKDLKEKFPDSHIQRLDDAKKKKEIDICRRQSTDNMIALPPPRPTSLTKARKQFISQRTEETMKVPKTLSYRVEMDPAKTAALNRAEYERQVVAGFYTDRNVKSVVYKEMFNTLNHVAKRVIGKTIIPNKEEWISSEEWMTKYSLKSMGLNLLRLVSGPDCKHEEALIAPLEKFVEAKYCAGLFPIVNIRGTRKHMQFTPSELVKYDIEAKKALLRYLKRLEWLMIGSKRVFGVITEQSVAILMDTSGSMNSHMPELILNLKALIWEQLYKRKISFNLIAFNSQISRFRERLVVPDEVNCHSAIGWAEHLAATGNTDTTKALLITLEDPRIQSVYLLSDGKPDSSTEVVLDTIKKHMIERNSSVRIHTISFNCEDRFANKFLKDLSNITGGRYHKVCHDFDVRMFSQRVIEQCKSKMQTDMVVDSGENYTMLAADILSFDPYYPPLPNLEGDDSSRLTNEIQTTRTNLSKTNYFRQLYLQMRRLQDEKRLLEKARINANFR